MVARIWDPFAAMAADSNDDNTCLYCGEELDVDVPRALPCVRLVCPGCGFRTYHKVRQGFSCAASAVNAPARSRRMRAHLAVHAVHAVHDLMRGRTALPATCGDTSGMLMACGQVQAWLGLSARVARMSWRRT